MKSETHQQRRKRLRRIKRPRLNSRGKRRVLATASMTLKLENYKAWLDTVIGRLEGFAKAARKTAKAMGGVDGKGCVLPPEAEGFVRKICKKDEKS